MTRTCVLLLLGVVVSGCCGQFLNTNYCGFIQQMHCEDKAVDNMCGTDGTTYRNDCAFTQAHCRNSTILVAHRGACAAPITMGMGVVTVAEIAFDVFCLDLFRHSCDNERRKNVCGTDGQTYPNLCEFDKARCMHKNLRVVRFGRHC